jgi:hypothetical protein
VVTYISDIGHISHSLVFNKQFGLDGRLKLLDHSFINDLEFLDKIAM